MAATTSRSETPVPTRMRDDELRLAIGRSIRQYRDERGMTQGTLASQIGVTRDALAKMELAQLTPTVPMLVRLAEALDVTLDDLVPIV